MHKLLFLLIYILISSNLSAQDAIVEFERNTQMQYESSPQSFKSGVPFWAFKNAINRYVKYTEKGSLGSKTIITFVNFDLLRTKRRMFIINIGSGSVDLILKTYTSHGSGSSNSKGEAEFFSNVSGSYKSSLGFYITKDESYIGKHGKSLALEGKDSSNSKALSRYIVMHSGWYVSEAKGIAGRSQGCFVYDRKYLTTMIDELKGRTLLYAFDKSLSGNSTSLAGVESSLEKYKNLSSNSVGKLSSSNSSGSDSKPSFADAKESNLKKSGRDFAETFGVGISDSFSEKGSEPSKDELKEKDNLEKEDTQANEKMGVAHYKGNKGFEQCQLYANEKWEVVAKGVQAGQDGSKYFKGAWKDLYQRSTAKNEGNIEYENSIRMGNNLLGTIRDCVAMAAITDLKNFPINSDKEKEVDGIKCKFDGEEVVDFNSCIDLVNMHEAYLIGRKDLYKEQGADLQSKADQIVDEIKKTNNGELIEAALGQDKLRDEMKKSGKERKEFHTEHIKKLTEKLGAMPTHASLLSTCKSRFLTQRNPGLEDYKEFAKSIYPEPESISTYRASGLASDPCARILGGAISYRPIQHHNAKMQVLKAIERLGGEKGEAIKAYEQLQAQRNNSETFKRNESSSFGIGNNNFNTSSVAGRKAFNSKKSKIPSSKVKGGSELFGSKEITLKAGEKANADIYQNLLDKQDSEGFYKKISSDIQKLSAKKLARLTKRFPQFRHEVGYEYKRKKIRKKKYNRYNAELRRLGLLLGGSKKSNKRGSGFRKVEKFDIRQNRPGQTIFDIITHRYKLKKLAE